ncbi:MAG: hypothetical protein RBS80_31915 [Thermoguttaceae bacterium]|nr:hypothetical protein [Thermoguttaceae bacterium]
MLSLAMPESSDGFGIFSAPLFAQPAGGSGFNPGTLNLGFATFDAAGRVASLTNANGSNTRFTYDGSGNLATVLDPVGNLTQWVYNAEGQVAEEINPLGDSRLFEYDAEGNLARYTDRNGRVRVYEYDHQQRVTAEIWYADAADGGQRGQVLTFDFYECYFGREKGTSLIIINGVPSSRWASQN